MAVAQFNSEENRGNILKLPVLTNSVKVQQKIVDLINYNKIKRQNNTISCKKIQAIQLLNQMEHSNQR